MAEKVSSIAWYHTIELADGTVTPGRFDTRRAARRLPFPETISLLLTLAHPIRPVARLDHRRRSQWWTPNVKALHRWVVAGGYRIAASGSTYHVKAGPGFPPLRDALKSRRASLVVSSLRMRLTGIPHAWVRATPLVRTNQRPWDEEPVVAAEGP